MDFLFQQETHRHRKETSSSDFTESTWNDIHNPFCIYKWVNSFSYWCISKWNRCSWFHSYLLSLLSVRRVLYMLIAAAHSHEVTPGLAFRGQSTSQQTRYHMHNNITHLQMIETHTHSTRPITWTSSLAPLDICCYKHTCISLS